MIKINEIVDTLQSLPIPDRRKIQKIISFVYTQGRYDERIRILKMANIDKKLTKN